MRKKESHIPVVQQSGNAMYGRKEEGGGGGGGERVEGDYFLVKCIL